MKQTINKYQFVDAFKKSSYENNFSYEGLDILFEYLENYESDCGVELELDLCAIACDYSEFSLDELISQYSIDVEDCEDKEEKIEIVREWLNDNTSLCGDYDDGDTTYFVFCSSF